MQKIVRTSPEGEPTLVRNIRGEMEYLTFPALERLPGVRHLFTTRTGGVSRGEFRSLNLSFSRGDDPESVLENFRRVGEALGVAPDRMVSSRQTHTTNIRRVTAEDAGKGVVRPFDYSDVDGMITDERGLALACFYADCVPLYLADPVRGAIGLAHSGWKGTVGRIGACMVREMTAQLGSDPKDLVAAVGPSICRECYEVSEDVAEAFRHAFQGSERQAQICGSALYGSKPQEEERGGARRQNAELGGIVLPGRCEGKYQLDLWLANAVILCEAGVPLPQISVTDVCTCHNPEYLFSHRASQGRRGNLGAFLMLEENDNGKHTGM